MKLTDEERRRFRGQNAAIVARLELGPATNAELAAISLKYTSRISEIRQKGIGVDCEKLAGGRAIYTLAPYRIVHREPEQLRLL